VSAVTSTFSVPGLHCAGCIAKLEGGLARTDGVISASPPSSLAMQPAQCSPGTLNVLVTALTPARP